jgi:NAD dependent epimerase/dehydratase family enzyme
MFLAAIDGRMSGTFNASSPTPVPNAVFMKALRDALGRPWSPPTPAFAVRLGSVFLQTEPELALTGRRCIPTRLLETGFIFSRIDLNDALNDILRHQNV